MSSKEFEKTSPTSAAVLSVWSTIIPCGATAGIMLSIISMVVMIESIFFILSPQ